RWKLLSGSRVTISCPPKYVSARFRIGGSVSWKSIISPSIALLSAIEEPGGDLRALLARVAAVRLNRKRALVVPAQDVFPREGGPAEDLDRPLAGGDGCVCAEALGRRDRDRRLLIVLRDAPGSPVGQRTRHLRLAVGVGERMRHR